MNGDRWSDELGVQVDEVEAWGCRVRVPFRASTALVTVEREGVAEAFVTRLSGRDPHVRLKTAAAHAPNVFVSVLALRGRVAAPAATGLVDLARPASKLGVTELRVGLAPHTLEVRFEPEHGAYRVREKARARTRVRTPDGRLPPAGSEVAVAVVDEALLELAPNDSWNLLDAMHGRRDYGVRTSTAQQQVVGKRHYGLKARPAGGGGAASATRELFDTLLFWSPRIALDAKGEASVEFALNDSLTQFRVAAIATGGADRFGTGFGRLRTTQDLMVLPGVAPVAARQLGLRGHRVDIFTRAFEAGEAGSAYRLYENVRLIALEAGAVGHTPKTALYPYLSAFFEALERFRVQDTVAYDLIHSHYWLSGQVGAWAQKSWGVPHVTTFHTLGKLKRQACGSETEPDIRMAVEHELVGACERILITSEREKGNLLRHYPAREETMAVVPCGVNLNLFRPLDKVEARRRIGVSMVLLLQLGQVAERWRRGSRRSTGRRRRPQTGRSAVRQTA